MGMGYTPSCGKTHPGNDWWWAFGSNIVAQSLIHTPVLPTAPHTPVGGIGSQTQATVTAAEGAVVESHCGGQWTVSGRSGPYPTFPRFHLPCSLLSIFLSKDLTYR